MALIDLSSRNYFAGKDIMANFNKLLSTSTDVQNVKFGTLETTGNSVIGGDLYTVAWTDYSATSIIVGWSSFTVKVIRYKKMGNTVIGGFYIAGTSNSTSTSFTLPYTSANTTVEFRFSAEGNDNGVDLVAPIKGSMSPNTNQVNFYVDFASTAWTASGDKAILGEFWYEAA